jgi:hypothetical protein
MKQKIKTVIKINCFDCLSSGKNHEWNDFYLNVPNIFIKKHAAELHNICLVFPNRRSGVFFNSYLQNEITGAVIAPETTTIGELISGYSNFFQAERLQLISVLYDVFQKAHPNHRNI